MRISRTTYSTLAAGFGPWVPVDYLQRYFNLGLSVLPSAAATGASFSVQFTMDDLSISRPVTWSQALTTVTITDPVYQVNSGLPGIPHGLVTGDSITIQGTKNALLSFDGTYQATVTGPTTYTITVTPSQTANGASFVIPERVFTTTGIPALSSARISATLLIPCTAVRLAVAGLTAGSLDFLVVQGIQ